MALLRDCLEHMKAVPPGRLVSRETVMSPRTVCGTAVGICTASLSFSCSASLTICSSSQLLWVYFPVLRTSFCVEMLDIRVTGQPNLLRNKQFL